MVLRQAALPIDIHKRQRISRTGEDLPIKGKYLPKSSFRVVLAQSNQADYYLGTYQKLHVITTEFIRKTDLLKSKFEKKAKNFIRSQLENRDFELVRRTPNIGPSIDVMSVLLENLVHMGRKGAIIQIGANDGVMDDPVRQAILNLNLPALLVEPLPDIVEKLKSNYAGRRFVRLENVAISTTSGEAEIFRVSAQAHHLPAWTHGIASFDKKVLLEHRTWPGITADF